MLGAFTSYPVSEVVKILQQPRRTVYLMLRDGRLKQAGPARRRPARITAESIEYLLASASVAKAAEILGLSRRSVHNRIKDGRLEVIPLAGRSFRISKRSIDAQLALR